MSLIAAGQTNNKLFFNITNQIGANNQHEIEAVEEGFDFNRTIRASEGILCTSVAVNDGALTVVEQQATSLKLVDGTRSFTFNMSDTMTGSSALYLPPSDPVFNASLMVCEPDQTTSYLTLSELTDISNVSRIHIAPLTTNANATISTASDLEITAGQTKNILMPNLPTADPHVAGALFVNANNHLCVSTG